jgi:alginate O-acetyltransferase complex protein AlgJ
MTKPDQALPSGGPRREEAALLEIAHTIASPFTIRLLVAFFLAAMTVVPIAEFAVVRSGGGEGMATAWSRLSGIPMGIRADAAQARRSSRWDRIVSANRIALTELSAFERSLENESLLARTLRPPAQLVLTGWLGAGNEQVYPGRDRWLFYREDVDYVTGHGFLDPAQIERRIKSAPEWTMVPQPDPRVAIVQFRDDLEARGIALIVMPTPVKPSVHPEMLARGYADATTVLQNSSYRDFVDGLRRVGVNVFDPSDALAVARRSGPQYLATDTHWRPESMEAVAALAASVIENQQRLSVAVDPGYRVERVEIQNTGDVARMLDLAGGAALFPPEAVWLRRILQEDGSLWRSSRDAELLVLGDSFSNIYTLESMGWGTSAGFVEQLSYLLRLPIDRLVQNDEGAFATREMLQRDPGRLDGKRVVIYQFAARELMFGDWKVMAIPPSR